jgi:hypothetical protein
MTLESVSNAALSYDSRTNTAVLRVKDPKGNGETVKYLTPGEGSFELQYYEQQLAGKARVSQHWWIDTTKNSQLWHLHWTPVLTVKSNIPDDMVKEDVTINLEVTTDTGIAVTRATLEGYNFPVAISDVPSSKVVELPVSANGQEIQLPVDSFFKGPITDYKIDCPFCDNAQISLETSIELVKSVTEVTAAVDYASYFDKTIVLSNNRLVLLNEDLQVVASIDITQGKCNHLA